MSKLPPQFQDFSVFSFQGQKGISVENTGKDFKESIEGFLTRLIEDSKPLKVALDLSVLEAEFLQSQALGRKIKEIIIEGRKNPEKKVEFVLIGLETFKELAAMTSYACKDFPVTDFEPRSRLGN